MFPSGSTVDEEEEPTVDELRDSLDHPVFFVLVLTIAVFCTAAVYSWGFKAMGWPGPAGLFQHP